MLITLFSHFLVSLFDMSNLEHQSLILTIPLPNIFLQSTNFILSIFNNFSQITDCHFMFINLLIFLSNCILLYVLNLLLQPCILSSQIIIFIVNFFIFFLNLIDLVFIEIFCLIILLFKVLP